MLEKLFQFTINLSLSYGDYDSQGGPVLGPRDLHGDDDGGGEDALGDGAGQQAQEEPSPVIIKDSLNHWAFLL